MNSPVEQIKERLDLADFVGQYVQLSRAGVNMKGKCPFHQEKTPSFFVSPTRQTWHCFGCNKGGDAFSFLQEIEGASFREALETLGARVGVEVKAERPEVRDARDKAREANEIAAQFFVVQLKQSKAGTTAKEYLLKRGLNDQTIEDFHIGWAPMKDSALLTFLKSRSFSEGDIVDAGLAVRTKRGVMDRFRGRIVFPIADGNDRVVGFTGRIFGREEGEYDPKYSNTPETPIFEKGRMLYGLHRARRAIRSAGYSILVEGQMDTLMAHQVGSTMAVATSGTALTEHHLTLLKRLADTIIVSYDADAAGIASTKRSIELALEAGMNVKIALVPEGKDPADLIAADPDAWKALLTDGVRPVIAFLIDRAVVEYGIDSPETKQRVVDAVLPLIARMTNAAEQGAQIANLATRVQLSQHRGDEMLFEQMKRLKAPTRMKEETPPVADAASAPSTAEQRRRLLEAHLLALLLAADEIPDETEALLIAPEHRALHQQIQMVRGQDDVAKRITAFSEGAPDGDISAERVAIMAERLLESVSDLVGEVGAAVREIRRYDVRERLDGLSVELEQAERKGDSVKIQDLTEQFRTASQDLASLAVV